MHKFLLSLVDMKFKRTSEAEPRLAVVAAAAAAAKREPDLSISALRTAASR